MSSTTPPSDTPPSKGNEKENNSFGAPFLAAVKRLEQYATASLQPHVASVVIPCGKLYCSLLSKAFHKKTQHKRFKDDDELIPKSARLKDFEIRVPKKFETTPEYAAIKKKVEEATQEYRMTLKANIIDLTKGEEKMYREEAVEALARGVKVTIQTILAAERKNPDDVNKIVSTLLNRHDAIILKHSENVSKEAFITVYKTVHDLKTLPNPERQKEQTTTTTENTVTPVTRPTSDPTRSTFFSRPNRQALPNLATLMHRASNAPDTPENVATTLSTDSTVEPTVVPAQTTTPLPPLPPSIPKPPSTTVGTLPNSNDSYQYETILAVLEELFIYPWDDYLDQHYCNESINAVKKIQQESTTKTTEDTAVELEKEASVNPELLKKLIEDSTAAVNKPLKAEIQRLTKTVNYLEQKNLKSRGQGKGASGKKENKPKAAKKKVTFGKKRKDTDKPNSKQAKKRKGEVGESNKGSKNEKRNKKGKDLKGKAKSKKPDSKMKQSKKPRPSARK